MATKSTSAGKRKLGDGSGDVEQLDLFVDAPPDASDAEDGDSTDSEDSEYSGLEEEEDDSEEEEDDAESFEEASSSNDDADEEEESDDDEEEDDDDDDDDDSNQQENEEHLRQMKMKQQIKNKKNNASSLKQQKQKSPKKVKGKPKAESKSDAVAKSSKASTSQTPGTSVSSSGGPTVPDEFEFDSSDEEDIRTTIGNIPVEWYREFEHLGYDWDGKKVGKPKAGDQLDKFLDRMENPNFWRTVKDKVTGQNVVLSDEDVEIIQRLKRSKYVDANYNPYEAWVDFFTHEKMIHPVTNHPAQKRSFIPSKWERLKVGRMVHAIKMGWMKPTPPKKEEDDEPKYYMLWDKDDQSDPTRRYRMHIPAPKMALPGHEESYNPPPEYLLTEEEELTWKEKEPEERKLNFIPEKYSCLRHVPAYQRFINERFERCLDLYLCPRQRKMRMNVNPEDLLPKLPKPQDLQPFPTTQALVYKGHTGLIRSIDADPTGQWLISGSDDKTVRLWEVATGRCMKTIPVNDVIRSVAWNPNPALCLAIVALETDVIVLNPLLGDKVVHQNTDNILNGNTASDQADSKKMPVEWHMYDGDEYKDGLRLVVKHSKKVTQVTWHAKGDYFAVVMPDGESQSVFIHQLSKRRSQNPFRKPKGLVQCVLFHPTRPFFFVATQRYVRVYNLLKQELTKKLLTNCKWVSSMAVHPGGDNLIIGSYDSRLSWFDLDLSNKPYQTLRHHKKALRQVCYHKRYPLFASASDDGTVIVCHGMVYNDLLQNPLIVPVKILRGHSVEKSLGVLSCQFHPTQPWIFTSGADSTIRLYT